MIEMPNKDNREKVAAIIALYNHTFAEIVRYRDMEWKITAWSVGLLVGIIAGIRWFDFIDIPCGLRLTISLVAVAIAAYSLWHLHYVHKRLTEERQRRRDLQRTLGFFKSGVYDTESLLPEKWESETIPYSLGIGHLISWALLIVLVTFSVIVYITSMPKPS